MIIIDYSQPVRQKQGLEEHVRYIFFAPVQRQEACLQQGACLTTKFQVSLTSEEHEQAIRWREDGEIQLLTPILVR